MTLRVVPIPAQPLEESMIRAVTVDRDRLLARLKENRATHERKYLEAFAGYKDKLQAALAEQAEKIREGVAKKLSAAERIKPGDSLSHSFNVSISVSLEVPEDHRIDYDRAIDRLSWETSAEIQVTEGDFNCFVRDEWDWQARFQGSHRHYTG